MAAALQHALALLKPEERVVFNLVAIDGVGYQEAAQRLRRPLTTVKSQYYRARDLMRLVMEKRLKTP